MKIHWIDPYKDLDAFEIAKYEDIDEVAYYNGPIIPFNWEYHSNCVNF